MINIADKLEKLVWVLRFGRPQRKITSERMLSQLSLIERPIFFLSTGRCGTKWFSEVLEQDPGVKVLHAPSPSFSMQNSYLFDLWQNEDPTQRDRMEFCKNLFITGREQHLRYMYKCNKRYVETNNHITFFAPALAKMFPDALFVHLYRHPGEFVRSGIRRGWFGDNESATLKMIRPSNSNGNWESYNQVQKIAWAWNETNLFIEKFKAGLDSERHISFNFNHKDKDTINGLLHFLEVGIPFSRIESKMSVRINKQKSGDFPKFENWNSKHKSQLLQICQPLIEKYDFNV